MLIFGIAVIALLASALVGPGERSTVLLHGDKHAPDEEAGIREGGVQYSYPNVTTMAVTMPNMPWSFSGWVPMWQCQAHVPAPGASRACPL